MIKIIELIFFMILVLGCQNSNQDKKSNSNLEIIDTIDTIVLMDTITLIDTISKVIKMIKEDSVDIQKPLIKIEKYNVKNPENINASYIKLKNSKIKYDYLLNYSNIFDYRDSLVVIYHGSYKNNAVVFEDKIISLLGNENNDGIFVWNKDKSGVNLNTILDKSLHSGSMMGNEIDTIIRLKDNDKIILGNTIGGDEEDEYKTFWIGIWSNKRNFKIGDFYSTSSLPIQGTYKYNIEDLSYRFNSIDETIKVKIEKNIMEGSKILTSDIILDTILKISDLKLNDRTQEFN